MTNAKGINNGVTNNIVTVKVPVGIPASGKSTWAAAQVAEEGCVIHSSDAIRAELKLGYAKEDHQKVFSTMRERTIASLKRGQNVVYDATNISEWARSEVYKTVKAVRRITGINVEIEIYYFDTPIDVCIERNSHREGAACVPVDCINRMAANLIPPTEEELLKNGVADIAVIETVKYEKEDKTMKKVANVVTGVAKIISTKAKEVGTMGVNGVTKVAKKVTDKATGMVKEDNTMNKVAGVAKNNVTVDEKMTKAQLADELRKTGIDLGASVVKNIKKAELIAMLKHELEAIAAEEAVKPGDGLMVQSTKFAKVVAENLGVETVVVGDMTTDKKPVNSAEMGDKEAVDKISIGEKVLIQGLVNVWVYQTVNKWNGWKSLFFKATRGDYAGKYIASSKSLTKVTGDVITKLFGEQKNNLDNIHTTWTCAAKAGMCSYDGKFVSIDADQWKLCVKNYNAVQAATKAAGKASVSEYLKGFLK